MKKISFIMMVLLLAFTLFLVGCSKKEEVTKTEEVKVTAAPVKQAQPEDKKQLVYWSMWNETEPQGKVIAQAAADFMNKNPDVELKINWAGREIRKTLAPALNASTVIDLWDEDFQRVVQTWGQYALPLDSYVAKAWPGTNGKPYYEAVNSALLDQTKVYNPNGKLLAATYQPFVFAFMYNKDHFDEAGITEIPKTWQEFVDVCDALVAAGYTPITVDDAYVDTLIGYYLARAKGSDWVEKLVNDKTNKMWDDPAVLQMAKDFESLAANGYFSETVGSNRWPAGQQDIASGEVSMYLNGTWLVNELIGSTGPGFPWGTFSFPTVKNGVDDTTSANYGAQAFQINKNSKYPEEAFKFIVHMTTGKWDKELAEKTYGAPVGGTTDWPKELSDAKALFPELTKCYPWAGGIQANSDKQPIIAQEFTKLISGSISAEEFVAAMKR